MASRNAFAVSTNWVMALPSVLIIVSVIFLFFAPALPANGAISPCVFLIFYRPLSQAAAGESGDHFEVYAFFPACLQYFCSLASEVKAHSRAQGSRLVENKTNVVLSMAQRPLKVDNIDHISICCFVGREGAAALPCLGGPCGLWAGVVL